MKIALVGGTGDIGNGFAMRWAAGHEIIIGSRKAEKALDSAAQVLEMLGGGKVCGTDNKSAVESADVVVLCVPYEHLGSVTTDLRSSYSDQLVVSPVVPMSYNGKYFVYTPPPEGSAALQAKALLPDGLKIVSAFHTICAAALQDRSRALRGDVMICGDDQESKDLVAGLVNEVKDLRPLDAGPLSVSSLVESLTPMLLNVARRNKIKDAGIKIIQES
jgi:NADPH-dependent F420 reductase